MMRSLRVVLGRFEDLVALGLTQLVTQDSDLDLVADRVMPTSLERAIAEHSPQVAVLNAGSVTGPTQLFQLHQAFPACRLVVLVNRPTAAECNQMLSFGATACLSKETEGPDVVKAIHLASRGIHVLPRSAATASTDARASTLLTRREADVLEHLQNGASNAQIALDLSIGLETVRTHARNIYRKLKIRSRRDLVRLSRPDAVLARSSK